jgi:hypothetical protein
MPNKLALRAWPSGRRAPGLRAIATTLLVPSALLIDPDEPGKEKDADRTMVNSTGLETKGSGQN